MLPLGTTWKTEALQPGEEMTLGVGGGDVLAFSTELKGCVGVGWVVPVALKSVEKETKGETSEEQILSQ